MNNEKNMIPPKKQEEVLVDFKVMEIYYLPGKEFKLIV